MSDYTIVRAAEVPDFAKSEAGGFLGYSTALGAAQLALNVRVLAPGAAHVAPGEDPGKGHSHVTIEEIYFVLEGEIAIKVGDEIETLGPRDAILVPPATPRQFRNESDREASVLLVSVKVEDQRAESRWHEGFWSG